MASMAGQKRKADVSNPRTVVQSRKRQKGKDARSIPTQTVDAALSTSGELNIAAFVKAREFEIAALDLSMKKSKKSLSQRAFQQLPRHMRRRTASHNVKKIPRRLRSRATREIREDNTPTGRARRKRPSAKARLRLETANQLKKLNAGRKKVRQKKREAKHNAQEPDPEKHQSVTRVPRIKKNRLAIPPQATSKYKRRQVNKTWLPTHLWHTKRAHMTRPTLPLWRMALPLKPTEKAYRATHRAANSRGCVAWDVSYMSTVGCLGTEAAINNMLKALGFPGEGWSGTKYRKWKAGTRFSEGWASERDGQERLIAPITVIWQVQSVEVCQETTLQDSMDVDQPQSTGESMTERRHKTKLDRRVFLRVHPSAFHQFWLELLKVAKMQKPQVLVEDLRFEIGSITVSGPGSTEALVGVLKPANDQGAISNIWSALSALSNPASLPQNAMLAFDILDPRYNHPPKQAAVVQNDEAMHKLNETIVSWAPDNSFPSSKIFDHKERYRISKTLPSQKAINRRRATLLPGQDTQDFGKDPHIPVMLLAHRSPNIESSKNGSWTVLLPWSCVDILWRSVMYYPLVSGATPRFGGLEQSQQVAFENAIPWYPGDYPGLEAGKAWDRTESEKRFDAWLRRPTSKRFAWDALDLGCGRKGELGRGWACDWEYLFHDTNPECTGRKIVGETHANLDNSSSTQPRLLTQRQRKVAAANAEKEREKQTRTRNTSSPESDEEQEQMHNDVKYTQIDKAQASDFLTKPTQALSSTNHVLAAVRIRFLTRGTPKPAARIYRLPYRGALTFPRTDNEKDNAQNLSSMPSVSKGGIGTQQSAATVHFNSTLLASDRSISGPDLCRRWLALDPNPLDNNPHSSTNLPNFMPKEHRNRTNDPVSIRAYVPKHTKDLNHIRVFPPRESKPQVLNMFGPPPAKKTAEELLKAVQPQLVPRMIVNSKGELVEETLWDKHVPCPDPCDLVGFVTSGDYSLSEGCGVAIGSLWLQRIAEGWRRDEAASKQEAEKATAGTESFREPNQGFREPNRSQPGHLSQDTKRTKMNKKEAEKVRMERQQQKQADRERHLCIVRNAGESVGRLAIWELC